MGPWIGYAHSARPRRLFFIRLWDVFFRPLFIFLALLWLPFLSFGAFWKDFGFHFGYRLASICESFLYPFSSTDLATFYSSFLASSARPLVQNIVIPKENLAFLKNGLPPTNRKVMIVESLLGIFWDASLHTFRSFLGTPFCIVY